MDERPRNLKAMLSEAKDTSELMVDLGYAALFFADDRMADELLELEERLTELVHEMRAICVLAGRSKRDAEQLSSVLHVVSAIERMGNAAVDISRIVTHRLGIPAALVADLGAAEEVSHRVRVREGSALANRALDDVELPMETGMPAVANGSSIPTTTRCSSLTTSSSCAAREKASVRCANWQARPSGGPRRWKRILRSPIWIVPSTCWSR